MSTHSREKLLEMFDPMGEFAEERIWDPVTNQYMVQVIRYWNDNAKDIWVRKKYNGLKSLQTHEIKMHLGLSHKSVQIGDALHPVFRYIAGARRTTVETSGSLEIKREQEELTTKWYGFDLQDLLCLLPLAENPILCHSTFLLQLLKAAIKDLFALYSVNLIHCDIKPDNLCLMVDLPLCVKTPAHWQGSLDPSRLKVIDLGLSFVAGSRDLHSFPDLENFSINTKDGRHERVTDAFTLLSKQKNTDFLSKLDWRVDCYDMGRVFQGFRTAAQQSPHDLHGPDTHSICFKKLTDEMADIWERPLLSPPTPPYLEWLKAIQEAFSTRPPQQEKWPFFAPLADPATHPPSERRAPVHKEVTDKYW